ncbi:MAG TPA: transcriptional repressor LexA [Candidatus Polarisedimenticolaceae bacterium]|nr:transcriptional repressor LexA [Candidatus Polarisedimenticolaceae bacterium]
MGRTPPGQTRERVFRWVQERLLAGEAPSVRDVQEAFDFRSPMTAREHLETLVTAGRLRKEPGLARGYRLPGRGRPAAHVPLLGRVPAGPFEEAIEDVEEHLPVEGRDEPERYFALRVKGDSMVGAGILDGDLVIVRRQDRAGSGDVVVAKVGDEATVKRLRLRGRRVELHAENPAYAPIVPEAEAVEIVGKVVEVRRRLEGRR